MSIKVMTYVWDYSKHKGSDLLTLLAIADFAHDDGTNAYPSIKTLAEKTRMSERNVQIVLKKLEDSKELSIERNSGPHGCHVFTINVGGVKRFQGEKISGVKNSTGGVKRFQGEKISGVKNSTGGVKPISPNPLLDPLGENINLPPIAPREDAKGDGIAKVIEAKAKHILEYMNSIHKRQLGNTAQIATLLGSKEFIHPITMEDCKLVIDWLQHVERVENPEAYSKWVDSITPFRPKTFDRHLDKARQWDTEGRKHLNRTSLRSASPHGPNSAGPKSKLKWIDLSMEALMKNQQDRERFKMEMDRLLMSQSIGFTTERVAVYWDALSDLPIEAVVYACKYAARHWRPTTDEHMLPRPATLREYARAYLAQQTQRIESSTVKQLSQRTATTDEVGRTEIRKILEMLGEHMEMKHPVYQQPSSDEPAKRRAMLLAQAQKIQQEEAQRRAMVVAQAIRTQQEETDKETTDVS